MEEKNYQSFHPAVYMPETDVYTNAIEKLNQKNRMLTKTLEQVENKTYQQITAANQKAWRQEATRYEEISLWIRAVSSP